MAFDILFLDIQMEGMDGMEAARLMRARGYGGMLIFITVLKEEVFEAFEVRAFDYLVKPLEDSRFKRTMGRTLAALVQEPGNCLVVQKGNLCQAIPFTQIIYCEVLGRKVYIHQKDGMVMDYYDKLEDLEKRLDSRFSGATEATREPGVMCADTAEDLRTLWGGSQVPVSRLRGRELKQALLMQYEREAVSGWIGLAYGLTA